MNLTFDATVVRVTPQYAENVALVVLQGESGDVLRLLIGPKAAEQLAVGLAVVVAVDLEPADVDRGPKGKAGKGKAGKPEA